MKRKDDVSFDAVTHSYFNTDTGVEYTPVTSWIAKHKREFVADESKTRATQRKLGLTHEEVLSMWEDKKNKAGQRGSYIHNTIEDYLVSGRVDMGYNPLNKDIPFTYLKMLRRKRAKLWIEDMLWYKQRGIAGQSDLVLEYKRHVEITDWKTNEKETEALSKVMWYTENFKELFVDLPQTSLNEYVIQLVLYGIMASYYYGKPCRKHTVVHIFNGYREIHLDKLKMEYYNGRGQKIKTTVVAYVKKKLKPLF